MVTAVDIQNAPDRESLAKLRATVRGSRTRKMKELVEIRNRTRSLNFDDEDGINDSDLADLYSKEEKLEYDIEALAKLADQATCRISELAKESFIPPPVTSTSPVDGGLSTLVTALTSALHKPPDLRARIADINGLSVASKALKDPFLLPTHFKRVEQLFVASGFAKFVDGKFTPDTDLEGHLVEKLIDTLTDNDGVIAEANATVDEAGGDWDRVKSVLLDKFSRPDNVRRELRRRTGKLAFRGALSFDSFVADVRQLRILANSVCHADSQSTPRSANNVHFINSVLRCLPSDVYADLVKQVTQTARLLKPESISKEWQLRLPFDGKANEVTILSILGDICQSLTVVSDARKPSRFPDREAGSKDIRDRLLYTSDSGNTNVKKEYRGVMDWARQQPYVLFVTGPGVEKLEKAPANSAGLGAASEVKYMTSRRGQRYALLAFATRSAGETAATDCFTDRKLYSRVKQFDADYNRESKNSRGRASQYISSSCSSTLSTAVSQALVTVPSKGSACSHYSDEPRAGIDFPGVPDDALCLGSSPSGVQQQRPLSEVSLDLCLTQGSHTLLVTGIVDTGASASYLVSTSPLDHLPFDSSSAPNPAKVQLADGRCIQVHNLFQLAVSVRDISSHEWFGNIEHTFRFLPLQSGASSSNDVRPKPYCLVGRDLIDQWQILCKGVSGAWIADRQVYGMLQKGVLSRPTGASLRTLSDDDTEGLFYNADVSTKKVDSSDFSVISPAPVLADSVRVKLPSHTEAELHALWRSIASRGWLDVSCSGSYHTRVRPLLPAERLDVPNQTYVAELWLPKLTVPRVAVSDYAGAMYRRLSAALKQSYSELVSDFVAKGFWVAAPFSNSSAPPCRIPVANVFLVSSGANPSQPVKSRLCDLRPINSALPSASLHGGPSLYHILCSIRLVAPCALITADIKSAFYSVRICAESGTAYITMKTANGTYITTRVSFGIGAGPLALRGTLGVGVAGYRDSDTATDSWLHDYFDDLVLAGMPVAVARDLCQLLYFLALAGFLSQEKKLAVATAAVDVKSMQAVFTEYNVDAIVGDTITIFNVAFSYVTKAGRTLLTTDCRRALRVGRALDFFQKDSPLSQKLTKKDYFGVSGLLSFDCAKLHARARLLADVLRSVIGGYFADIGWDVPCDLAVLDADIRLAYLEILRWGQEICKLEAQPCSHDVAVRRVMSGPILLEVCSDASLFGGGYAIYSDGELIYEDAVRFTRSQTLHSSNRRELRVCLLALRKVAEISEYCCKSACKRRRGVSVDVCFRSDNRPSLAWIRSGSLKLQSSKVLERRALFRLVDSIGSELNVIRKHGTLSLEFIPGSSNVHADALSRLLDRPVTDAADRCLGEVLIPRKGGDVLDTREILEDQCCAIFDAERQLPGSPSPEDIFLGDDPNVDDADLLQLVSDSCCLLRDDDDEDMPECRNGLSSLFTIDDHCRSTSILSMTMMTAGTIFSARDSIGRVSSDVRRVSGTEHCDPEPIIEGIARNCYDLESALWRVRLIRLLLKAWRAVARGESATLEADFVFGETGCYDRCNIAIAARSAQKCMLSSTGATASYLGDCKPQDGGPLHLLCSRDCPEVYVFRGGLPSGEAILSFYIPRSATILRRLIILDAHRRSLHSGLSGTLAAINHFHLTAIVSATRDVIGGCIACRLAYAVRGWHSPPGLGNGDLTTEEMSKYPPYTFATADVIALGEGIKAVSVQCRFTRHCIWRDLPSGVETTANVISTLARIQVITGGMKILWVDCASYFRSREFRESSWSKLCAEVRLLSRHAPWTGSHERHHRTMLNYLRNLTRNSAGRVRLLSPVDRETLYDRVALTHNTMPLGGYVVSGPELRYLCPDLLAYGHVRTLGASAAVKLEVPQLPYRVCRQARQVYLSEVWSRIKKANANVHPRLRAGYGDLDPGSTVLVYIPTPRKLALPFVIAHVVQRLNNRVEVVHPTGARTVEHSYNVVPLSRHPSDYTPREQGPSLVGLRLRVWIVDTEGRGDWYEGEVADQCGLMEVLIRWSNGEPEEWIDLTTENWCPLTCDGDVSP
ncbi:hypothetical protein FOL47_003744 [Perkinsus chesapeaki]|uniref:Uncharacterized protein n=1 Tax=Perkinsus chesapeaki TaxID=330153 RepID=A0A7J6M686_PERCH|nr:hypothetical protein FOL47_003744 [Perkinsus chesapeaki]